MRHKSDMYLIRVFEYLKKSLGIDMSAIRKGKAQAFYQNHKYTQIALSVKNEDDDGVQRTIQRPREMSSIMLWFVLMMKKHLISSCNPIC